MELNGTKKENRSIHWGMDTCYKCHGEGEIVRRKHGQLTSFEDKTEVVTCPVCDGDGMVPKTR